MNDMEKQIILEILKIIAGVVSGSLAMIFLFLRKSILQWFINVGEKIAGSNNKHGKIKPAEIEKDMKIREILIELRTLVKADRASLFQFHNGDSFSTSNPIFKVSNTHESVAPGISSEIGGLQDIKASSLIEHLKSFWKDHYEKGLYKISPDYCAECPTDCSASPKKVIFLNVSELEDGYEKSSLVEQGIKYLVDVPIHKDGSCIGFVTVNYCFENDIEKIKKYAREFCKHASQIEFVLLN